MPTRLIGVLILLSSVFSVASAQADSRQSPATMKCQSYSELEVLAQTLDRIAAKPSTITQSAKSQLVGVFDGGWLIATALGDLKRADCFAALSDTLGLSPALSMTGDDTKLEKAQMPPGLATQVHQTAMQIIRRL